MDIIRDGGPLPRDLVTRKSLENACAVVAATGGSTNLEAGLTLAYQQAASVAGTHLENRVVEFTRSS